MIILLRFSSVPLIISTFCTYLPLTFCLFIRKPSHSIQICIVQFSGFDESVRPAAFLRRRTNRPGPWRSVRAHGDAGRRTRKPGPAQAFCAGPGRIVSGSAFLLCCQDAFDAGDSARAFASSTERLAADFARSSRLSPASALISSSEYGSCATKYVS